MKGSDAKKFGAKKAPARKLAGMATSAAGAGSTLPALPTDGTAEKGAGLKAGASKRLAGLRR